MKQKTPTSTTTTTPRSVLKHHQQQQHNDNNKSLQSVPQTATTRLRVKASSKAKESPKTPPEIVNRVSTISSSSTRAKSVPPDMKNNSKAKRSIFMNKVVKSIEEEVESSHKGSREGEVAKVVVVAPPRRRRIEEDDPDVKEKKELLEKLEASVDWVRQTEKSHQTC